jgi:GT2 family glycosyltransferase
MMLRACLEAIAGLLVPDGATLSVVVVENDAERRSESIVCEVAAATGVEMRYSQERRRGIPFARNQALDAAIAAQADWIGMVDDDERVERDWLIRLASACETHRAEVGQGPVKRIFEAPVPRWWKAQSPKKGESGTEIGTASTNNVLVRACLVRPDGLGLRFDERLTFGNEDLDFFRRAHALGARMIWVADAWVVESIPASRVRPGRLISRLHMAAAADTFNTALHEGRLRPALRLIPRCLLRIVLGSLAMLAGSAIWPVRAEQGELVFFYGATRVAKAAGNLRGLFGYAHRYYDRIDGS